jgi:hypothetical protein
LTYEESRMWEQMFIDDFGLDNLLNEMNGVARKNRWWDKLGPP